MKEYHYYNILGFIMLSSLLAPTTRFVLGIAALGASMIYAVIDGRKQRA